MAGISLLTIVALYTFVCTAIQTSMPVQYCPISQVCYQVAIPEASAARNGGNIYLQLRAPISYSWVAFGTGEYMKDSSMYIMYQDGNGNVTVSARTGTGHNMPRYNSIIQLELLAGSGLLDDGQTMVANLRCGNCGTWPGGTMSLDASGTPWIAAWKTGDAVNSADPDAQIRYHEGHDSWEFDLTEATVTDDANPYVNAEQFDNNNRGAGRGYADPRILITSHGVIMAVVMILLYPMGAALMPLTRKLLLHVSWQLLTFILMWAGFGLGLVSVQRIGFDFHSTHTLLGTVVVSLMGLQPVLGWLHHRHYQRHQTRNVVTYTHMWFGRALIVVGIINGGLGLRLAGSAAKFIVVYSVFAVLIAMAYVAISMWADFVQELYLKELKAYKAPPVKDSDSVGQVQTFTLPKTPKSPEETDLASSLKEYESMAVEVEGNEGAAANSSTPAVVEDWLVDEEDDEGAAAHH
ncbi:putative iron reductase domain protein [Daldinia eschscholtzii]|nr:putative iron reductase domain protein [Daldinia eschscholtzii]